MADTAPAPSMWELYPIQRCRFVSGRTFHRVKEPTGPDGWDSLLQAACGKTGYLATGYPGSRRITPCTACETAVRRPAPTPTTEEQP
jgi:hypothetical protein